MSKFQVIEADLSEPQHQRAIVELLDAYAQIPTIRGKPLSPDVRRDLIPGLQRHPTTIVFLAFDHDLAVGIGVCFVGFSTFAARPLMNLHDLAVQPEYQGQGVGRQILDSVERRAQQLRCCKVTLEVDEKNDRARRIYAAAGFDESLQRELTGRGLFLAKQLR